MKRVKHSKIKNTGILFELLLRQVSSDVVSGNMNSKALTIVKEYFGKGSEIFRELELYQTLINTKFNTETKANSLVEAVIQARQRLNTAKIRHQKYLIIKEIQGAYDVEAFFGSPVPNYKEMASIYKLFEVATSQEHYDPTDVVQARATLTEHISAKSKSNVSQKSQVLVEYESQPEEIRLLTTKLLIDKFNQKYSVLTESQKVLLREFINNTSGSFHKYIASIIPSIKAEIIRLAPRVKDKVVKIKLMEVAKQLDKFTKGREVKDDHVVSLLNYIQLAEELKKL